MINNLKKEYELRYKIIRYKKLYKAYLYSTIEKHNAELLFNTLYDMKTEIELRK